MDKFFIVSLDPAQLHDYSALAVLECTPMVPMTTPHSAVAPLGGTPLSTGGTPAAATTTSTGGTPTATPTTRSTPGKAENIYRLVSLKRKQKLPYPEIVAWSRRVYLNPKFQRGAGISEPRFVIDAGGVGRAILDMLTAEYVKAIPIQLTGGEAESCVGGTYHVSKSFVVGKFLAAWDAGRVQVPSTASFLPILENELRAFRGAMTAQGRAKFEAEQGEHDDLVMALAQAIWYFEQHTPQPTGPLRCSGALKPSPVIAGSAVSRVSGGLPSWLTPEMRRKHAAEIAAVQRANRESF